jgi:hypothetical protein
MVDVRHDQGEGILAKERDRGIHGPRHPQPDRDVRLRAEGKARKCEGVKGQRRALGCLPSVRRQGAGPQNVYENLYNRIGQGLSRRSIR